MALPMLLTLASSVVLACFVAGSSNELQNCGDICRAPDFITHPVSTLPLTVGTSHTFHCKGANTERYSWHFQNITISYEDSRYQQSVLHESASLSVLAVSADTAGAYQCAIHSSQDRRARLSLPATLHYQALSYNITQHPQNFSLRSRPSANPTWQCIVRPIPFAPHPLIYWQLRRSQVIRNEMKSATDDDKETYLTILQTGHYMSSFIMDVWNTSELDLSVRCVVQSVDILQPPVYSAWAGLSSASVESNIALPPEIMVESGSTVGFPSAASSGVLVTWFWRSIIQDRVVPGETFIGGNLVSRMSWLLRSNSQNFYAVGQQSLQHNISTSTQVVRKSNVAGHPVTEATTDVIVLRPPEITLYSAFPAILEEHSPVHIQCKATGVPSPTVWLTLNGVVLFRPPSAAAVNFTLVVENVHNGILQCWAMNIAGTSMNSTSIIVKYRPIITSLLPAITYTSTGDDIKLICRTSAIPTGSVYWLHNTTQITSMTNFSSTLLVRNVSSSVRGEYTCVTRNSLGHGENFTTYLQIRVQPSIDIIVGEAEVVEGDTLTLSCEVQGVPDPDITWTYNDGPGTQSEIFKEPRNSTLVVRNVTAVSQGTYICIATNGAGQARSTKYVTVHAVPQIKAESRQVYGLVNTPINITCFIVGGRPAPSVDWLYSNGQVRGQAFGTVFAGFRPMPFSTLSLRPLTRYSFGQYECVASNMAGTASAFIDLIAAVQPEDLILNSLHAAAKDGPSMLHMNVTFGFNGGLPITSIFALFVDNSSDHEVSLYIPVRDDTPGSKIIEVHSRNVSALRPGHTYFVTVRASSEAGSTNVSNTIVYTLPCYFRSAVSGRQLGPILGPVIAIVSVAAVAVVCWIVIVQRGKANTTSNIQRAVASSTGIQKDVANSATSAELTTPSPRPPNPHQGVLKPAIKKRCDVSGGGKPLV